MTKGRGQSSLLDSSWVLLMFIAALTAPDDGRPNREIQTTAGEQLAFVTANK